MEVNVRLSNLGITPRKVRLVADLVRGKSVAEARLQLRFNQMRAAKPLLKLIESGVANASHNFGIDEKTLQIKSLMVDQGPMLKRYMARAFGRGAEIQKRMSHIRLVLDGQVVEGRAKQGSNNAKVKGTKEANPADQEKQKPAKTTTKGVKKATTKKPESVDPRMTGKARNKKSTNS